MTTKGKSPERVAKRRAPMLAGAGDATPVNRVPHMSMVEQVSRELRQAVLDGRLRPGQTFSITGLCSDLGVSHIPVREALRRLESQGLVELRPGRSGVVAPIGVEDLTEIYTLRVAIETELISSAGPLYSEGELEVLHQALLGMELGASDPQGDEFWKWHSHFHWQLLEPSANAWSERILAPLWHAAERYIRLFYVEDDRLLGPMRDHRNLYDAATRRSPDDLSKVLRTHLHENLAMLKQGVVDLETHYTD